MSANTTICKLKWNNSHVSLQVGRASGCCVAAKTSFTPQNFIHFHNSKERQAERAEMLAGHWPQGCESCSKLEAEGAISQRIIDNAKWGIDDILNYRSTIANLDILELSFNNVCNFSCIYCRPELSNTWDKELERFGPIQFKSINIKSTKSDYDSYQQRLDALWDWCATGLPKIKELFLVGGEPLLLEEVQQTLDLIDKTPCPNLDITIFSNLGIPPKLLQKTLDKLTSLLKQRKIKTAKIIGSIDGWGPEVKFQRWGIDLDLYEENINQILARPYIFLGFNLALTCLTIPALPALIEKINSWTKIKKNIHISCREVDYNSWLELDVLPFSFLRPHFLKTLELLPQRNESEKSTYDKIQGFYDYLKSKNSNGRTDKLEELNYYLSELSTRRNTDWKDYYPWLVDLLSKL